MLHRNRRVVRRVVATGAGLLLLPALNVGSSPRHGSANAETITAQVVEGNGPDAACARCHSAIVSSYAKTPMARASGPAGEGLLTGSFVHQPSGIRYSIAAKRGQATLRYERVVPESGPALEGSVALQYYIGSNTRGRTYLFAHDGLWFETPINWYSKRKVWDMAPGFEQARSMPLTLPATAGCLRCHATAIATPTGAENHFAGAPFAQAGIGCSACHGDSAAHAASGGRVATLNPAKLSPVRRDSICLQCHLEGDAVVMRSPDALEHFLPGDDLSAAAVYFVNASSERTRDRATSQYEALLRSACRRASGDRLTCTTCHDPHSSPEPAERVAFFRSKCLACHTGAAMATEHHPEQPDCAACHMPSRKTADISHEQLTDHDIEAVPRRSEAAPATGVQKGEAAAVKKPAGEADLVAIGDWAAGSRERGIAYAQFAALGDKRAADRAISLLREAEFEHTARAAAHAALGYLLQTIGHLPDARAEYLQALHVDAQNTLAAVNLATLAAQAGDAAGAKELLHQVVLRDPGLIAADLDLALLDCRTGQKGAARTDLQRALAFDPDNASVRRFLDQGRYGQASCAVR